ncbi:hypothetical protein DPMN_114594 [Dreissena polymorpha]|uniref:Uncharacterized protein n=1 Tax=Dreissena polymorpha TaxID=45954 RepID=A0A9D4KL92_DREPO|nr:hypothetical protein DPMN_114594 [Dreissena polymorpha]
MNHIKRIIQTSFDSGACHFFIAFCIAFPCLLSHHILPPARHLHGVRQDASVWHLIKAFTYCDRLQELPSTF